MNSAKDMHEAIAQASAFLVEWHSLVTEYIFDHIEEIYDIIDRHQQQQKYQQHNYQFRIVRK